MAKKRCHYCGKLFQHDLAYHLWLPSTGKKQYLIITKDDYSRMIVGARIVEVEISFEYLQIILRHQVLLKLSQYQISCPS